jgi:glycosyltransferase involved in cell wall biosynthesis
VTFEPAITVVIPTFNRATLLPRALKSLRAQTRHDWECVIVDDGSTDDTQTVLTTADLDERIRIVRTPNRGPSQARNSGIALANAPLIAFLDSDDEHEPHHLAYRIAQHQADSTLMLAFGGTRVVGDEWVRDFYDPTQLVHASECTLTISFTVRTEFLRSLGGFDPSISFGEDADLRDRALLAAPLGVRRVSEVTSVWHRGHTDSLTYQATLH